MRPCVPPEELVAWSLGELPDSRIEEVAAHLEVCPRCAAAAEGVDTTGDPFVRGLRSAGAALEPTEPAGSAPAALPRRVGEHEILGRLGEGGMGVVYKARHARLRRVVALKMLPGGQFTRTEDLARFRAEAEAVARLQHPNIVQIFEVGEWCGEGGAAVPYFALEYVEGGNLSDRLQGKPQAPSQAALWTSTLARAVHHAHERSVVHRDLKPSNVLVADDGRLKLCDFGGARRLTGSDLNTRSGMLIGTAEYMAPEQAGGQGNEAGPAADVYSLGALLYAMLTGRPPPVGVSLAAVLEQVRSRDPVPPRRLQPAVPRDLNTICLKCLRKDPRKRYASAAALADDLDRFLAGRPV
ncbi:MAG TPA: protein kinase, partial [Gemmataceae bacterium]|nr:protein kinase [Gemmataceae bacterium]